MAVSDKEIGYTLLGGLGGGALGYLLSRLTGNSRRSGHFWGALLGALAGAAGTNAGLRLYKPNKGSEKSLASVWSDQQERLNKGTDEKVPVDKGSGIPYFYKGPWQHAAPIGAGVIAGAWKFRGKTDPHTIYGFGPFKSLSSYERMTGDSRVKELFRNRQWKEGEVIYGKNGFSRPVVLGEHGRLELGKPTPAVVHKTQRHWWGGWKPGTATISSDERERLLRRDRVRSGLIQGGLTTAGLELLNILAGLTARKGIRAATSSGDSAYIPSKG